MSETLYLLEDADKTANTTLTTAKLKTILLDNDKALRLLAYGPFAPTRLAGHDHGARRGELLDEHYHASTISPYENAAGDPVTAGCPLYPNQSGFDFVDFPKLIDSKMVCIAGGIDIVTVRCKVFGIDSSADISLRAEFRPLGQIGYVSGHSGVYTDKTLNIPDSEIGIIKMSVDLTPLGNISRDRDFELFIWLIDNPEFGFHRYAGCTVIPGEDPGFRPPGGEYIEGANLVDIDPASILSGQFITGELGDTWRSIVKQEAYETFGAVASLLQNLNVINSSEVWESIVTYPHQHQGRRCLNDQEEVFFDGAVRYQEFFSQSYLGEAGEDASYQMNTAPYQGILTHGQGSVASQGRFVKRLSLPSGCRTISLFAALDFETVVPVTRLWVCAFLTTLANVASQLEEHNLLQGIESGSNFGGQITSTGHSDVLDRIGYYCLPVDPLPSAYYLPNFQRKQAGLGLWTRHAEKSELQLRALGLDSQRGKYRTTQEIKLTTQHLPTGDYQLKCMFILQLGDFDSDVLDEDCRLQWWAARPVPGY